jgi:hypothetical protein
MLMKTGDLFGPENNLVKRKGLSQGVPTGDGTRHPSQGDAQVGDRSRTCRLGIAGTLKAALCQGYA